MEIKYQIILLGNIPSFISLIKSSIKEHILELGISEKSIIFLDREDFLMKYKNNSPAFCLYFGGCKQNTTDLRILKNLQTNATLVLPIVDDLKLLESRIPDSIAKINSFELDEQKIETLANVVLESFDLLRKSRRLFISYKRNESSSVAINLYEQLEKAGFDVFLDTHSIRPGEKFQEELWHRLVDTDVVVLLNTPNFIESKWTKDELAKANSMSIGIVQLVWPNHKLERESEISFPINLKKEDFINDEFKDSKKSYLKKDCIDKIVENVEALRARTYEARHKNLIGEICSSAKKYSIPVCLFAEKYLTLKNNCLQEILLIPAIGVPRAFTYNDSYNILKHITAKNIMKVYLVYDHRNIKAEWLKHLKWLDDYLPVKSVKIVEIEKWITKF